MKFCTDLFTLLLFIAEVPGLRWTHRGDNSPVDICSGEAIELLFNFTLGKGERLKGMVWGCQPEGKEEDVLATYVDDHFVPMSRFSGRLTHLQGGGIELSCATILESGNYSIAVSTEDADNVLTVHRHTAAVNVVDTPKTQNGLIHVTRKEEAVRDVTTGAWHVQLSCGNFSDRGHPPVDVIWTTPSGGHLESSSYQDGFFHLLLPNPVKGGNYSCSLHSSQPAAGCLSEDSALLHTQSVEVDQTAARLSLLEARQQEWMEQMKTRQQEMMEQLTVEGGGWRSAVDNVANRTEGLEQWRDEIISTSVPTISFHARLSSDTYLSTGTILKLDKVITNQGQGYNVSTGHFTAPANGSYFFIATTGTELPGYHGNMVMMKEGEEVAKTFIQEYNSYEVMGSCHAALLMRAGEKVWVEGSHSKNYFYHEATSFSGFRI